MDASVGLSGSLCPPRGVPTCACHHDGEGPGAGSSLQAHLSGELQPLTWEPKVCESDWVPGVRPVATKHKPDVVPGMDGRVQAAGSPVWLADPRGDGCWITAFLEGSRWGAPGSVLRL